MGANYPAHHGARRQHVVCRGSERIAVKDRPLIPDIETPAATLFVVDPLPSSARPPDTNKTLAKRSRLAQETLQSIDAVGEPFLARRKAPAHEPFAFGSEGNARREAEARFGDEAFAELEAVGDISHAKERIHRARR